MTNPTRYLELLSRGPTTSPLEGKDSATTPAKSELLDRLEAEIAYVERKSGVEVDAEARRTLLALADEGLSRLLGDGPAAVLGAAEVSGLEAVIRTDGSRPVVFVDDDFVDLEQPSIEPYAATLSRTEDAVRQVCRSVGRVDDPSTQLGYRGTAWMLAEGLVATNYHVLRSIAPGGVRRDGRFRGRLNTGVSVHFGHEVGAERPERRFPIRRVVCVGREGAARYQRTGALNFDGLDLAVLELEPVPGRPFPEPGTIAGGGLATAGRGIYLVGYPGDPKDTTPDLFASLFDGKVSFKRLAPGRIVLPPGEVPHDPRGWILTHDASTLGGNSGSALVDLDENGRTFLGLHFAGAPLRQNWAHALERMSVELGAVLPPSGEPR
jgi:trypsin-like peptidase